MNCIVRYFPCSVTSQHHVAIYSSWLKPGSVTTQSRSLHRRSVRFFRMPWNRRRGRLIGSFVAESEGEGSVPDVGSTATDSEDTEGELDRLNGGYGRALYCGYYRARCHNDASQSGTVVDCASYCAVRRLAWLGRMVFAGIVQRRGPMLKIGSQHLTLTRR